ncbi:MAG: hypothetical protein QXU69_04485 [Thermofilaceae archaeon]
MSEGEKKEEKEVKVEVGGQAPPKEGREEEFDLLKVLRGWGLEELDPISRMIVVQELVDEWRERREERRERRRWQQTQPQDLRELVRELVREVNATWESRFKEYQASIEKLLIAKKLEEAEERAARLEKELKERERREELERSLKEKIEEGLAPYKEEVKRIQELVSEKLKVMSEGERKGFFQALGEQIEKQIGSEVSEVIAKQVASALVNAFTPKEEKEEVPVTKEGEVDKYRMVDRWIRMGLRAVEELAKSWSMPRPPMKEVRKLPVSATAPPAPTAPQPQAPPAEAAAAQPTGGGGAGASEGGAGGGAQG